MGDKSPDPRIIVTRPEINQAGGGRIFLGGEAVGIRDGALACQGIAEGVVGVGLNGLGAGIAEVGDGADPVVVIVKSRVTIK